MPDLIQRLDFLPSLLPSVQHFDCGDAPWEREVATWIKATDTENSVLADIANYGTRVWLYLNDAAQLVGYGSLGKNKWGLALNAPRLPLSIIPMLGVHFPFRGLPRGADETIYADQILADLRAEAAIERDTRPILGLCVHPQNTRAIHFYRRHGFTAIEPPLRNGYLRMAVKL